MLSEREKQCLMFAADDKGTKETSKLLKVSLSCIRHTRSSAIKKMGCRTITGAFKKALDNGYIKLFRRD